MDERHRRNLTQPDVWLRLLFVMLFAVLYSLAELILAAVIIMQFIVVLATGVRNERLLQLGNSLSIYAYQVWMFFTFNSDVKPYPFAEWPSSPRDGSDESADSVLPPSNKSESPPT